LPKIVPLAFDCALACGNTATVNVAVAKASESACTNTVFLNMKSPDNLCGGQKAMLGEHAYIF
jgi:hypothetical protein